MAIHNAKDVPLTAHLSLEDIVKVSRPDNRAWRSDVLWKASRPIVVKSFLPSGQAVLGRQSVLSYLRDKLTNKVSYDARLVALFVDQSRRKERVFRNFPEFNVKPVPASFVKDLQAIYKIAVNPEFGGDFIEQSKYAFQKRQYLNTVACLAELPLRAYSAPVEEFVAKTNVGNKGLAKWNAVEDLSKAE